MNKYFHKKNVELVCKWFDGVVTIKSLFSVAYVLIVANICKYLIDDPNNNAFLSLLLSLISCMFLIYISLAGMINKTKIVIGKDSVRVRNYPLPFPGNRIFPNTNIVEYHTRKNHKPNRLVQTDKFEIHALNDCGQQFKVLNGITCFHRAELIRKELAKHSLVS